MKQRIRYRFPKHETIDQLENVFVFDLETYNDEEFAEAYAAGLYVVNRLRDRWYRNLRDGERETERENITVFDRYNSNPVLNMLQYISENYKAEERSFIVRDGDEIVSLCRLLMKAHNSSGFDGWVPLTSLAKGITELKILKTARELISL